MKRYNKNTYKPSLRDHQFTNKIATRIWSEKASSNNPYIAESCLCHGYDLFELLEKRSFIDVIFLLLRGELPSKEQSKLLESLMIGLINPGPRHPATRAAMHTGVGKTDISHILPISLSLLSGTHLGGSEVCNSMRFLNKNNQKDPEDVVSSLINNSMPPNNGDVHIAPGFGTRFGSIDSVPRNLAHKLTTLPSSSRSLEWGQAFSEALEQHGYSWLNTGVAAAVFSDLGFHPRAGSGLFQIASAPGLLAHGLEMSNKPITAMPFIDNEHYIIEGNE